MPESGTMVIETSLDENPKDEQKATKFCLYNNYYLCHGKRSKRKFTMFDVKPVVSSTCLKVVVPAEQFRVIVVSVKMPFSNPVITFNH